MCFRGGLLTVRVLHVSDTHLGKRQYRSDLRKDDFLEAFEESLEVAVDRDVDAVIHTGDLFDKRTPGLNVVYNGVEALKVLRDAGIPFYGIVGNHERKRDVQWLDLISRAGVGERLGSDPVILGDEVAVYGIDAVSKPSWEYKDFSLNDLDGDFFNVVCMHQLLNPPVPDVMADYSLDEVFNRLDLDVDALLLGDYHEPVGSRFDGAQVFYGGSTERNSLSESDPRTVSVLEIDSGELNREQIVLDTRDFVKFDIEFGEFDSLNFVHSRVQEMDVEDKVAVVTLKGERSSVNSQEVKKILSRAGAAVTRVIDERDEVALGDIDPSDDLIQDIDSMVLDAFSDLDLSEVSEDLDGLVRGGDVPDSGVREKAGELISERRVELFEEVDD